MTQNRQSEPGIMVVGVNWEASVKRLKGPSRPVLPARARQAVLSAFASVAWVCEFDDDTPPELIRAVEPDVLVKGGDYTTNEIVGADFVFARGGQVVTVPLVSGASTTHFVVNDDISATRDGIPRAPEPDRTVRFSFTVDVTSCTVIQQTPCRLGHTAQGRPLGLL